MLGKCIASILGRAWTRSGARQILAELWGMPCYAANGYELQMWNHEMHGIDSLILLYSGLKAHIQHLQWENILEYFETRRIYMFALRKPGERFSEGSEAVVLLSVLLSSFPVGIVWRSNLQTTSLRAMWNSRAWRRSIRDIPSSDRCLYPCLCERLECPLRVVQFSSHLKLSAASI